MRRRCGPLLTTSTELICGCARSQSPSARISVIVPKKCTGMRHALHPAPSKFIKKCLFLGGVSERSCQRRGQIGRSKLAKRRISYRPTLKTICLAIPSRHSFKAYTLRVSRPAKTKIRSAGPTVSSQTRRSANEPKSSEMYFRLFP